jgi:vitamin B12 transporter
VANNGGAGQTTRLFMRGTNSNHVLVLLDGVALNDPSDPGDAFDFSNLTTDNIEQIEVLRGAQSSLYGSQALGGVISITSKKGKGAPRHSAFAEYGRYHSARLGAGSSGEIGASSYSFHFSQSHTDGISALAKTRGGREKDGNDTSTFSGNVSHQLTDNFVAKLNLRYQRSDTEFDSLGSQIPRPFDDAEPVNDTRQWNGRAAGEWSHLGGAWVQELGVGVLDLNRQQITEYYDASFNVFFGRQQFQGWRRTLDWVHRVSLVPGHRLTFGTDYSADFYKSSQVTEKNVMNVGLFADDQITLAPNAYLNVAVRSDHQQSFGRQTTWKIAPVYDLTTTGTRLKTTYGTAFKAPSLYQLFDAGSGNPELKPEKNRSWDMGFEQSLWDGRVTFGATAFKNFISNLISFNPSPPFRSINLGKARTQGVESSVSYRPTEAWTVTAAHSFIQADDKRSDKRLLRRPRHSVQLSAGYQPNERWNATAGLRYVSSAADINYDAPFNRVNVPSFTTVDLSGNYQIQEGTTLYMRAENLLDQRYEEVFGFGQPGLSLVAGVKAGF